MNKSSPSKDLFKIMGMILMFVGFFIAHVALRTKVVSEGYEIEKLRTESGKLESQLYTLKAQKNALIGPKGLEKKVKELKETGVVFENPKTDRVIFKQLEGAR